MCLASSMSSKPITANSRPIATPAWVRARMRPIATTSLKQRAAAAESRRLSSCGTGAPPPEQLVLVSINNDASSGIPASSRARRYPDNRSSRTSSDVAPPTTAMRLCPCAIRCAVAFRAPSLFSGATSDALRPGSLRMTWTTGRPAMSPWTSRADVSIAGASTRSEASCPTIRMFGPGSGGIHSRCGMPFEKLSRSRTLLCRASTTRRHSGAMLTPKRRQSGSAMLAFKKLL
ncbi:hypothetical protein ACVIJ6_000619 [Bradyrhizobium sp. USDA 4369]